jgi:hypothetical protein
MPTPSNRTPIRVARGTYSNLNSSISDIQEGEICYATDEDKLYVKEGSSLVSTQADVSGKANTSDIGVTIQAYDADNAVTDATQTFTAGQRGEITTVTSSSGVLNIDFNASNNFYIELSENVTSVTVSNATAGQSGSIFIAQPASGGPYTVGGWDAAFLFSGATPPTITATNSKTDRVDYVIRAASEIQVVWTGNY